MQDDSDNTSAARGATRRKLARRQGGAAAAGLDREEATETLRVRKRSDGGAVRGSRAQGRRNAGGRVGGDQVARGGRTTSDRTGLVAALNRHRAGGVGRGRAGKASG